MAILKIARMGHPVLKKVAEAVNDPTAPEVERLVKDMIETMLDARGQGLAAPQVHVSERIVVYVPPLEKEFENESEEHETHGEKYIPLIRVLINPVVSAINETKDINWEGCLSIPKLQGLVPRFSEIRLTASRLDGSNFEQILDGWHARVIQHECDHLDGVLYPQRMTDLSTLMFETETHHLNAKT